MKAILTDLALLSVLLLVGITLRKKVKLFQELYVPASLLAGFVGLLLGPQILGKISPVCFPVTDTMIGCLKEGAAADIAIFKMEKREVSFPDARGVVVNGDCMLVPTATKMEGEWVFNNIPFC